jgi:hypothetical protein
MCGSSRTIAESTWNAPGMNARRALVGERHRLLRRQPEGAVRVLDVAARRLLAQPLADVALAAAGALGELRGRHRLAVRHRLVEAELVADQHERRRRAAAEILDELAHELLELRLVDRLGRHAVLLYGSGARNTRPDPSAHRQACVKQSLGCCPAGG